MQAILGFGRPGQSPSKGRRADRPHGDVYLQPGGGLVSPHRSSIPPFSLPTLVSKEGRTVIRRYVGDSEAGQLRRENPTTASETVCIENLDRPAHRVSEPTSVRRASAADSRLVHDVTIDSPGGISPSGPLAIRLEICETRTKWSGPFLACISLSVSSL